MGQWIDRVLVRWGRQRLGARLWWAAMASVATAAVVALAAITLFGASADAGTGPTAASRPESGAMAPVSGSAAAAAAGAADRTATGSGTSSTAGQAGSMASSSAGAMGAMGTGSPSSSSSSGSMATDTSQVCPNVANATVMSDGMVMAPVPTGPPTAAQQAAADQLVAQTTAALAPYADLPTAIADGYVPATNPDGYVVHYADWQTVRSGDVLDPSHPSALVYANTVSGPVLLGAMYMGPGPCQPGPDVGGSLTQWHAHDNLCLSSTTHQVVGRATASGTCASGVHNTATYFMLHVWTAPSLAAGHQFQPDLTSAEIAPIIRSGQP